MLFLIMKSSYIFIVGIKSIYRSGFRDNSLFYVSTLVCTPRDKHCTPVSIHAVPVFILIATSIFFRFAYSCCATATISHASYFQQPEPPVCLCIYEIFCISSCAITTVIIVNNRIKPEHETKTINKISFFKNRFGCIFIHLHGTVSILPLTCKYFHMIRVHA